MFKDLKLKSITLLFVLILACVGALLGYGVRLLESKNFEIDDLWHQYQVDRSYKSVLLSNLHRTIGYGGMIHNFKNYVLRHDPKLREKLYENFGAARSILYQYDEISDSSVERENIKDILSVFKNTN